MSFLKQFVWSGIVLALFVVFQSNPGAAQVVQQYPEDAWSAVTRLQIDPSTRDRLVPPTIIPGIPLPESPDLAPENAPDVRPRPSTNTTQSEMSIAVSPLDNNLVLASANTSDFPVSVIYGTGTYWSTDAGLTWAGFDIPPTGNNRGDPAAVIDRNGYFFVGSIAPNSGQGVMRSTDGGVTWNYYQVANTAGQILDKNHMMVDNSATSPHEGNLYAGWSDFNLTQRDIVITRSTDHGLTWVNQQSVVGTIIGPSEASQGVNIQTAPNGDVYATWAIRLLASPFTEVAVAFNKSTDGGVTWGSGVRALSNILGIRTTSFGTYNIRSNSFPSMAVSQATGHIYIVWTNIGVPGVNTGDPDIYLIKSTDSGTTWGTPVRVNNDPVGNNANQWFPWMTVDPVTNEISVVFYDGRNHIGTNMAQITVAHSIDGGATFENFVVSDASFSVGPLPGFSGNYNGDYIGIAARGSKAYPIWNSQVPSTNSQGWVSPILYADPIDPNPPTNVSAFSDFSMPTSMALKWRNPTTLVNGTPIGPFVMRIKRNGVQITERPSTDTTYTDTGLTDGTLYTYIFQTRLTGSDSLSPEVQTSWIAGGSRIPSAPTGLAVTGTSATGYKVRWTNPSRQIDGTRLDDLAGVRLYRDGSFLTLLARTPADTARADSTTDSPPAGVHSYHVTVIDNETPTNESATSNTGFTPLEMPLTDDFPVAGLPNSGIWIATNVVVDDQGLNEPSGLYSLHLDGATDDIATRTFDLTGLQGTGIVMAHFYQPRGTVDPPEVADSLIAEFQNSLGQWRLARSYPGLATGAPTPPYALDAIGVDGVDPGAGTFFYNGFKFRFRSKGTATDDWFVDDVFFGVPTGAPAMAVSPQQIGDTLLVGTVDSTSYSFTIRNTNAFAGPLAFSISENPSVTWLSASPLSGSVSGNGTVTIDVNVNFVGVTPGNFTTALIVSGNDSTNLSDTVSISFLINPAPVIGVSPDSVVVSLAVGPNTATDTLTILNTGPGILNWSLLDVPADVPYSRQPQADELYPPRRDAQGWPVVPGKDEQDIHHGPATTDGQGGPDSAGYRWIDSDEPGGPTFNWVDISGIGTPVTGWVGSTGSPNADDGYVVRSLPFPFEFYGVTYNSLRICTNGWLSFDAAATATTYINTAIPNTAQPNTMLFAWWDDQDLRTSGTVHEYHDAVNNRYIVQYTNVPHFGTTEPGVYTYQIIINANGSILYQYLDMQQTLTSASIGIENQSGTVGLQVVFSAAYMHNNLAIRLGRDIPWLSAAPSSGTVAPGSSQDVVLTFNSTGLPIGVYRGVLEVTSNDPVTPIKSIPVRLNVGAVDVSGAGLGIPLAYDLEQNYPNPFNPVTRIRFALPKESVVRLTLYDILGKEITTLVSGLFPAGYHSRQWNGTNSSGHPVGTGVYFYRIEASATGDGETFTSLKKLVLLK